MGLTLALYCCWARSCSSGLMYSKLELHSASATWSGLNSVPGVASCTQAGFAATSARL